MDLLQHKETDMAIKGLKEALAKKRAQQNPENQDSTDADVKITPTRPVRVGSKPPKRSAGRGR
jgi:hypothetical protein